MTKSFTTPAKRSHPSLVKREFTAFILFQDEINNGMQQRIDGRADRRAPGRHTAEILHSWPTAKKRPRRMRHKPRSRLDIYHDTPEISTTRYRIAHVQHRRGANHRIRNRKRSEAAKEQPRTETGFAERQVREQSVPAPETPRPGKQSNATT
jgi:hypothetical protein